MSYCDVNSAYRPGYGRAYLDGTISALPDALWSSRRDSFLEFSQQRSHDSPTPSCPSQSSTDASTWSPPPGTPWVTTERRVCRTPESIRDDCYSHDSHLLRGLNPSMSGLSVSGSCVALEQVQGYPDAVPDSYSTEDDYAPDTVHECYSYQATTYEAEHHYAPTFGYECSHASEIAVQQPATQMIPVHGQDEPSASPPPSEQKRQRRKSQQPSLMPGPTQNKVIKRPSPTRRNRTGSFLTTPPSVRRDSVTSQLSSAFPCPLAPYGCTSSFGTKNEWKRHVNTQHLRLDLWRCDQCPERDNGPNEFNRKDLFVQHLRRMHVKSSELPRQGLSPNKKPRCKAIKTEDADSELLDAEQRCHISLRQAPMPSARQCYSAGSPMQSQQAPPRDRSGDRFMFKA
ncbi:hypothetical protein M8818_002561 [Zalaria obscura]|uniref:Uncharacterized protein n=1 Tax=Zalaria obscura TaxID=2024903 RepID=A0ACC3SGA3_9PEZI